MNTRVVGKQKSFNSVLFLRSFQLFEENILTMTQRSIIAACQATVETVEAIQPYFFQSYYHRKIPSDHSAQEVLQRDHPAHYTIWEVLCASTATPKYFAPVRRKLREGIEIRYGDCESFGFMNSSIVGCKSIRDKDGEVPEIIISLGSGAFPQPRNPPDRGPASFFNILKRVRKLGIDAEATYAVMEGREGRTYYSQLSVQEGLGRMELDEWKGKHGRDTLRFIREKTERYLSLDHVKKDITEAARRLVEARRARASTDHWGRYCHGVEYVCTVISCKDNTHGDRADLRRHLVDVHQIDSSRIETVLDQGKRFPF